MSTTANTTASTLKFGIRFGNAKRGKIVTGQTVEQYLRSLGATEFSISPHGGWVILNGQNTDFGITIY